MADRPDSEHLGMIELADVGRRLRDEAGIEPVRPLQASLLSGGRSNLTFVLSDGESEWILRRPPLGHVLATAHDMAREVRVQRALAQVGFPVPKVLLARDEPQRQCYVMERVAGRILRTDADLADVPASQREDIGATYIEALAHLHSFVPEQLGLGDFGRPVGYLNRQVRRWSQQLDASTSRTVPGISELRSRLADTVPVSQRASVVHGDFRLDNMIYGFDSAPSLRAVLDWEMSTLGDPLTDLGLVYLFWEGWRGIDNPIAGTAGTHDGFLPWEKLAARYCAAADLHLDDFAWYQAFAFFKLAVILEGIHYRHAQGLTVGDGFDDIGPMVAPLVERGLAHI